VLVAGATIAGFVGLRALARVLYRRMGARYRDAGRARKVAIFVVAELVDVGVVLAAWALGYVVAATAVSGMGQVAILHTLYLNAFLVVELGKVVIRLVLSPGAPELRPLALSDAGARRLYRVLNLGVSLLGYGHLLLVPIANANASVAAGRTLAAIVSVATVVFLALAVIRYRAPVAEWLLAQGRRPLPPEGATPPAPEAVAADPEADPEAQGALVVEAHPGDGAHLAREPKPRGLYAALAANWHWIALVWLGWLLITQLARSDAAVLGALRLSLALGGGAVLAVVLSGVLGRAMGRGIALSPGIATRLPRLEERLNGFVPHLLVVLRVVVVAGVIAVALWLGGAVDLGAWVGSPVGLRILGTVVSVTVIVAVAFVLWLALTSWVDYRLNPDFGSVATARERTLLSLLRNALTIVLLVITLMVALSELGLDIAPLIASAGVIGLAIGFGAQKLVQDVITGVFIQVENAMNVGDVVTAGPVTGVVEKLTIRSVSLRDLNGVYHLIPFSSVDLVSNFTRDFSNYVFDMGVAYRENTEEVKQAIFDAFDELRQDPEHGQNILADLEWFGVERFDDSAVVVRARIRTLPGKQWNTGRAFNGIVKRVFDARGIEIPFPHTTLYFGESKAGETQAIHVADDRKAD
jgi:moderate conductance mechanosensitive channel